MKTVPEALTDLGALYKERNKLYGNNYKNIGKAFTAMFPKGVKLNTESDFNRFAIFVQVMAKITRYGEMFAREGHADSLDDITVYSQMLQELDGEAHDKG